MSLLYRHLLRPGFFWVDAETAHHAVLASLRFANGAARLAAAAGLPLATTPRGYQPVRLLGRLFPNRIGLAAGMDKNGVAPHIWAYLGLGFVEIGTVTWEPQAGNPRPRLFRLASDEALINRLGFPGLGAENVARRLDRLLRTNPGIPIGINIGASRSVVGDASAEARDQARTARQMGRQADFLVVNVSSPNTPGLRDQQAPERITRLVESVGSALVSLGLGLTTPAVLVKLSPDLDDATMIAVARAATAAGAAGFVAVNTTLNRKDLHSPLAAEAGGLSGPALHARATEVIGLLRRDLGQKAVLIGVGGVQDGRSARSLLEAGADLVELYTALVYQGPGLARRLAFEVGSTGFIRSLAAGET